MHSSKLFSLTLCSTLTLLGGAGAFADDTEVFFNVSTSTSTASSNPNVMLVLDTSGSMTRTLDTELPYNPLVTYSGSCDSSRVYFKSGTAATSFTCSSGNSVPLASFKCDAATNLTTGAFTAVGKYQNAGIRWRKKTSDNKYEWSKDLASTSGYTNQDDVTCKSNSGAGYYPFAGTTLTGTNQYAGTAPSNYWTPNPSTTNYWFYSANYANYLAAGLAATTQSRMNVVKNAAINLLYSLSDVNVGLMRYDSNGSGGMVLQPVQPIATGKPAIQTAIGGLKACGNTPLSETLYESYLYFKGGAVDYGNSSKAAVADALSTSCSGEVDSRSVATSRTPSTATGTNYQTPIAGACQKNHIVFLTDGFAYEDSAANSKIDALPGTSCYSSESAMWTALGESAPSETHSGGWCLKAMSKFMHEKDIIDPTITTEIRNVTTNFIGFGDEVAGGAALSYLDDAAKAGGGKAYTANSYSGLTDAFESIFSALKDTDATFTSPSVAVNAFNKTQVLEDMYVAMFRPGKTTHWDGNLKKFKFRPIDPDNNGETEMAIVGRGSSLTSVDTVSAVGSDGFFTDAARDFWHQLSDTNNDDLTSKGGAANRIPEPASRNVYTYISTDNTPSSPVTLSSHLFSTTNTNLTDALMGTGTSTTSCGTACSTLINWTRGDADGDSNTTGDPRNRMGDPIHSQPAVVIYGNTGSTTTAKLNDAVVYVATNDGLLQAIDVSTGTELWSYIPQELIKDPVTSNHDLLNVYTDAITNDQKHYSLDGDIRVLKYDVDNDGIVESSDGDRVFLYFSQGRGGDSYYALDVTNKTTPKFLWSLGYGTSTTDTNGNVLPTMSKSWSTPTLGRVNVSGATQNAQKLVLIFGGGYDDSEDNQSYLSGDSYGNSLYMVDAIKGTVLWHQTYSSDTTSAFNKMTHAIPSNVTVLDTNADGYSDRMYVGDMAGQIWRLDITNGNAAGTLVAGGVIASLGAKAESTSTVANNRVFYSAPDVSKFVVQGGANYYNIAIGSGDRALPKSNVTTQDFFYSIRDYRLQPITQTTYNGLTSIKHSDLTTVTGLSATTISSNGWKLALTSTEKALAQSVTVNGVVIFTTFIPGAASSGCSVTTGSGRAYTVKIADGIKYFTDPNTSVTTDGDGLYEEFATTGLPSQVSIVNESNVIRTDGTTGTTTSTTSGTCLSGVTVLGSCVDFGSKVKTFWQESGAD